MAVVIDRKPTRDRTAELVEADLAKRLGPVGLRRLELSRRIDATVASWRREESVQHGSTA
jgi:hypothetical protein